MTPGIGLPQQVQDSRYVCTVLLAKSGNLAPGAPGPQPSYSWSHPPVNCGATHAGVGGVDVRAINVVFGVLASCWAFYDELGIDYLSSFDIAVDLGHS